MSDKWKKLPTLADYSEPDEYVEELQSKISALEAKLEKAEKINKELRGALELVSDCDEIMHRKLNGFHTPDCALCCARSALEKADEIASEK